MTEDNSLEPATSEQPRTYGAKTEDIATFLQGLFQESERSAVVLGAARLDVALEQLLKVSMQHHPGGSDNLFDPDRPLGSFSAKISLAYRLGIIDSRIEHALQMIRRIRNDFAHSIESASLSESRHSNRLRELVRDAKTDELWGNVHAHFVESAKTQLLADFCTAVATLIGNIEYVDSSALEVRRTISFS